MARAARPAPRRIRATVVPMRRVCSGVPQVATVADATVRPNPASRWSARNSWAWQGWPPLASQTRKRSASACAITENGCAASDVVAEDGRVDDSDRVMFLRACLAQLQRATAEGVPVDGYFYWSAQDNFEWNAGFGNRFGIVYVDFQTLARTPKLSAEWFREAARRNAVV
jgi:beta-glucosidase/6-phospho-beta-glucosidase/beta-galactosidase